MDLRQGNVFDVHRIQEVLLFADRQTDFIPATTAPKELRAELSTGSAFRWFLATENQAPVGVVRFELFPDSRVALSTLLAASPIADTAHAEDEIFQKSASLLTKAEPWIEAAFDEAGALLTEKALARRRKIPQLHPAFLPYYQDLAEAYGLESARVAREAPSVELDLIELPDTSRLLVSAYEPTAQQIALHFGYWPVLYLPAFHLSESGAREDRILVTKSSAESSVLLGR